MSKFVNPFNPEGRANPANISPKQSTPAVRFKSWTSVYRVFMSIADTILELPEGDNHDYAHILINYLVNSLYAQHEGEDAWDIAFIKWIEPFDDDEELSIDESSPILK